MDTWGALTNATSVIRDDMGSFKTVMVSICEWFCIFEWFCDDFWVFVNVM